MPDQKKRFFSELTPEQQELLKKNSTSWKKLTPKPWSNTYNGASVTIFLL